MARCNLEMNNNCYGCGYYGTGDIDATVIGRQLSPAEIPVIYHGVSDSLTSIKLSQDNDGNYYVDIH